MGLSIFSTHPLHPEVTRALSDIGPYRVASAPETGAILSESEGANVIVVRAPIAEDVIQQRPGLRALVRHGAGLDMIPMDVATGAGVLVANVPGANAVTVAEHVIWSALALLRRFPQVNADLRTQGWPAGRAHSDGGREISGRTLGIVGMGNVGQTLAQMASAGFGMQVLCHTRSPGRVPAGVTSVSLNELLETADIIALCCPLTDATRGLIDAEALARMRPWAVLINVARGPVVVEDALIGALRSGHLGGAALDVFDAQPLPTDHPLTTLPNVVLTPHMAGITEESMLRMGQGVVAAIRSLDAGALPDTLVNPEALPLYRERFGLPG
ncbi:NAD(P)-dependent oxidoreductase [Chachezhania antarctica]|uniref:NAD(P)-dependent oxidoreductase n=1 Tax=Chachezhania antarctica TaxID=2340860 RepID=UPI000EAD094E|nr:NAD(P)-dependent oxidoreductase [Chachezhania antarctica]|tara:strand:- start:256 stop:1239 length:984 start_codon:yes stop_codon:yes gene_type:complete